MLYKLIIADDEQKTREGLTSFVDWASLGFELVATLSDGEDVITYIEQNPVHVILSDIKMTKISGIDIAKYVHSNKISTKVLLISAYSKFEYAQEAMQYNVTDYILKPVTISRIKEIFSQLKIDFDELYQGREAQFSENFAHEETLSIIQKQFISDIIMGAIYDKNQIEKYTKLFNLNINVFTTNCILLDIYIPNCDDYVANVWNYGKNNFYDSISNFIETSVEKSKCFYLTIHSEHIKVLLLLKEQDVSDNLYEYIKVQLQKIQKDISAMMHIDAKINIDSIYKNLIDMANRNPVHFLDLPENDQDNWINYKTEEQYKLMLFYIREANFEAVFNIFTSLLSELSEKNADNINNIKTTAITIIKNIIDKLLQTGMAISINTQLTNDLNFIKSKDQALKTSNNILNYIIESVKKSHSENSDIEKAKKYIDDNFQNDISLKDVSNSVFLTPKYFGRIFKKHTNMNFLDYLTIIRINKAKQLLTSTDYLIYEICNMCGYKTPKYFYKLFRDYTGFTPKEYRAKINDSTS